MRSTTGRMLANEVDGVRLHVSDRSSTGYKGVYPSSNDSSLFRAEISINGKTKRLGDRFCSAVEAAVEFAKAHEAAAAEVEAARARKAHAAAARANAKVNVATFSPGRATWTTKPVGVQEEQREATKRPSGRAPRSRVWDVAQGQVGGGSSSEHLVKKARLDACALAPAPAMAPRDAEEQAEFFEPDVTFPWDEDEAAEWREVSARARAPGAATPADTWPPTPLHEPKHLSAVHAVLREAARRFVEDTDGSASPTLPAPAVEPPNADDQDDMPMTPSKQAAIAERVTRATQAAQAASSFASWALASAAVASAAVATAGAVSAAARSETLATGEPAAVAVEANEAIARATAAAAAVGEGAPEPAGKGAPRRTHTLLRELQGYLNPGLMEDREPDLSRKKRRVAGAPPSAHKVPAVSPTPAAAVAAPTSAASASDGGRGCAASKRAPPSPPLPPSPPSAMTAAELDALDTVELARRVLTCSCSEMRAAPRSLTLLSATWEAADVLRVVAAGWTAEVGPMVTRAGESERCLDELGVTRPSWRSYAEACGVTPLPAVRSGGSGAHIRKTALLSVGDLRAPRASRTSMRKEARWVAEQFAVPPAERTHLLNCIHMLKKDDLSGGATVGEAAAMPAPLQQANLSRRWWPAQSVFALFTMGGASMSYHIDLWATAVMYTVLWGVKIFVVAPPTPRNLQLMRAWQERGGDGCGSGGGGGGGREDGGAFPDDLELASVVVLLKGQVLMLPSGWVHAVYTPVDSATLGWNFLPEAQLPTALAVIRSPWGARSGEIRQTKAFDVPRLAAELWAHAAELLEEHGAAAARGGAAAAAAWLTPLRRRLLHALLDFLRLRPLLAGRNIRHPPGMLQAMARLLDAPAL